MQALEQEPHKCNMWTESNAQLGKTINRASNSYKTVFQNRGGPSTVGK